VFLGVKAISGSGTHILKTDERFLKPETIGVGLWDFMIFIESKVLPL
jgi:hypothetical protein